MATWMRRACTVLTCFAVVGCGVVKGEDPLADKLSGVKDGGQAIRLSQLTDFSWDEVHLFNEYTRREAIEKIVGSPVISEEYNSAGGLLVFEDHGKVVKTVTVGGDYLRADGYTFGPDVLVAPIGNGGLRLAAPAATAGR